MWVNWSCSKSSFAWIVARLATRENSSSLSRSPMCASTRTPLTALQLLARARPTSAASSGQLTTSGLPPLNSSSLFMANEPSASTTSLKSCRLGAYTGMLKSSRFSLVMRPYIYKDCKIVKYIYDPKKIYHEFFITTKHISVSLRNPSF